MERLTINGKDDLMTLSNIILNGSSLLDIAQILRHKTMQMVKKYSHLTDKHTGQLLQSTTDIMLSEYINKA